MQRHVPKLNKTNICNRLKKKHLNGKKLPVIAPIII
jgi:hypothetical protein